MFSLRYLFTPHEQNNHRAKLLHNQSIMMAIVAILLFNVGTNLASSKLKVLGYAANISPQQVIELTNVKREAEGLANLTESDTLDRAAYEKGVHMLEHDYWAHVAPDGTEPWYFFVSEGYSYKYAGENLARDFTNPRSAVEAWMASPTHRENLLSTKYKEIGVAVVEGDLNGVETTIIVQFFGTTAVDSLPTLPTASANDEGGGLIEEVSASQKEGVEKIAGFSQSTNNSEVSPFWLSKNTSLILIGTFLVVFVLDSFIVALRGLSRVSGRQFAHVSFLGMVLVILIISQSGKIF